MTSASVFYLEKEPTCDTVQSNQSTFHCKRLDTIFYTKVFLVLYAV